MWRLRLFLIPFGAVVELVVLCACWMVARVKPAAAEKILLLAQAHLPSLQWYMGERGTMK